MSASLLPPLPRLSLRSRIALVLGGFSAILTTALCLLFGHLLEQRLQTQATYALRQTAHTAQLLLDHALQRHMGHLQELARSRLLWSQGLDSRYAMDALHRLQRLNPYVVWAGVATPQGTLAASTLPALQGLNAAERPWFVQAQTQPFVGAITASPTLQALLPRAGDAQPLQLLDMAAPIHNAHGQLQGVLAMHIHWQWVQHMLKGLDEDHPLRAPALARHEVLIFDHTGRLLYTPTKPAPALRDAALPPKPDSAEASIAVQMAHWSDSPQPFLHASAYLPLPSAAADQGWWVVARVRTDAAWSPAQQAQWLAIAFGVLCGCLAAWVAWALARRLTRDLNTLARASQQLLHTPAPLPVLDSSREVYQLSSALQHTTQQLLQAHQQMQTEVQARTQELQTANEALRRLAYTDPLTQILNRRGFERHALPLLQLAQRHQRTISLVVMDIDFFKRINDTHGHDAGDSVLQQMAQLLLARLRSSDLLARFGGEEFVVLLPDTDLASAQHLVQALLEQTAHTPFAPVGSVTLSAGISSSAPSAALQPPQELLRQLLLHADRALYRAKQQGRNQSASEPMPA